MHGRTGWYLYCLGGTSRARKEWARLKSSLEVRVAWAVFFPLRPLVRLLSCLKLRLSSYESLELQLRAESAILTNLRRKVFSRSAPMHPANPRMNITPPTTRKSQTGSKPPRSVMDEILDRTPWGRKRTHEDTRSSCWQVPSPSKGLLQQSSGNLG